MRPIVALLTDFGTQDAYAGALRGAVLAAVPEAQVVDLTHEVPPHDVRAAAFALEAAYAAFPAGAAFVAVVDPGVGSERRGIAVAACGYASATRLLVSPTGNGYWIETTDGTVVALGDARRHGFPARINGTAVGLMLRP